MRATDGGWFEKRRRIRADLSREFSARAGICADDFLRTFYDTPAPPLIREFRGRYTPDAATIEEILSSIASRVALAPRTVTALFSGADTFPQFGERLLRAGAYEREAQ